MSVQRDRVELDVLFGSYLDKHGSHVHLPMTGGEPPDDGSQEIIAIFEFNLNNGTFRQLADVEVAQENALRALLREAAAK